MSIGSPTRARLSASGRARSPNAVGSVTMFGSAESIDLGKIIYINAFRCLFYVTLERWITRAHIGVSERIGRQ